MKGAIITSDLDEFMYYTLMKCTFVTDLHGVVERYEKLFAYLENHPVDAVFIGGDILPSGQAVGQAIDFSHTDFVNGFLKANFLKLRQKLGDIYPSVFIILGNDDGKVKESALIDAGIESVWQYIHDRRIAKNGHDIYGYSYVPPSPFLLKDWERYDVSRFIDPGSVSPEEGYYTIPIMDNVKKFSTIKDDLNNLTDGNLLSNAIMLFHAPPYQTNLDHAALDGKMIDSVPLDVNVGSIAIRRLIEQQQPLITLHGHIHESASITGSWRDRIGKTYCFTAAHNGPELAIVLFDSVNPEDAKRTLI